MDPDDEKADTADERRRGRITRVINAQRQGRLRRSSVEGRRRRRRRPTLNVVATPPLPMVSTATTTSSLAPPPPPPPTPPMGRLDHVVRVDADQDGTMPPPAPQRRRRLHRLQERQWADDDDEDERLRRRRIIIAEQLNHIASILREDDDDDDDGGGGGGGGSGPTMPSSRAPLRITLPVPSSSSSNDEQLARRADGGGSSGAFVAPRPLIPPPLTLPLPPPLPPPPLPLQTPSERRAAFINSIRIPPRLSAAATRHGETEPPSSLSSPAVVYQRDYHHYDDDDDDNDDDDDDYDRDVVDDWIFEIQMRDAMSQSFGTIEPQFEAASAETLELLTRGDRRIISCDDDPTRRCPICLEAATTTTNDVVGGGPLVRTLCQHVYHESCIIAWMRISGTCPMCKSRRV